MVSDPKQVIRDTVARVDTKREYNLSQMQRDALFPWLKDRRTYREAIRNDILGPNVLQAKIIGEWRGRGYKITGKNIIKYLKLIGYAMVLTSTKIHEPKPTSSPAGSGGSKERRVRSSRSEE